MDLKIALNKLKFGQDDGAGINARVAGREDGIAELAANIIAQGQIENLIVRDVGDGFYAVANGNRRLAAFHMMYGKDSSEPIGCTLHDVDETRGFEISLTTAITAAQLHPVDQYEAFARLDDRGKTHDEIARQYGMTEKQVRQALALGRLSPTIRQAWRGGEIKAEIAKAFTLALDHAMQDKAFAKLKKDGRLFETRVKAELAGGDIDEDVAQLLDVVGAEAYRAAGGHVIEDLFGPSHIIGDEMLLKRMARQLLIARCDELVAAGWGWAEITSDLPKGALYWPQSEPKSLTYQGDEKARFDDITARLEALQDQEDLDHNESEAITENLERELEDIAGAVRARSFDDKKRATLGCIVDIEAGRIIVLYGIKKPVEVTLPSAAPSANHEVPASATATKTAVATMPPEPEISQALLHRLSVQLTQAAATALIQDEQLALSVLLAGFGCYDDCGVKVSVNGLGLRGTADRGVLGANMMDGALPLAMRLKPAERVTLLTQIAANALDFQNRSLAEDGKSGAKAICNAIEPKALNAALRGAFDAKDYFAGVNKALCLKAIEDAMGPDLARQQSKNPKSDIAAFAVANVPKTGWLPPQLRAKGYDGPPVAKRALAGNAIGATSSPSPARAKGKVPKAMKDALTAAEKALKPLKRAAAVRKAAAKKAAKTAKKPAGKKRKAA